jgi:hypothetical protein
MYLVTAILLDNYYIQFYQPFYNQVHYLISSTALAVLSYSIYN